jgi:Beta-propeller repeat
MAAAPQPQPFLRPLVFEPNRGQAPAHVQWMGRGPGYQLFLTSGGLTVTVQEDGAKQKYSTVQMKLAGSRPWKDSAGLQPTGGVSNYVRGKDGKDSLNGIPNYARVSIPGVYDGVDLVFYSRGGDLEYDFVVKPGADPRKIRLAFEGVEKMRVDEKSGDLVLTTPGGTQLRQLRPMAYQQVENKRVEVAGGYELLDHGRAALTVARYDRKRELVIDPITRFLTTFGGSRSETAYAVAVDSSGNTYVTGGTGSTDFPVTNGSKWENCFAGFLQFCVPADNIFVTKLSTGGGIVFSTYGGPGGGSGIAVDSTGVYVTGGELAPDCGSSCAPIGFGGSVDLFIWKLSPTGATIFVNSLAGSAVDSGNAIAVDSQHNAWVAGSTNSPEFLAPGDKQTHVVVLKYGPTGLELYRQTFGSNAADVAYGAAVDDTDQPWFTGQTCGNGWPTTNQSYVSLGCSVFVMQLSSTGTMDMSMVFGGSAQGDAGYAIVTNGNHDAYVTGVTNSANFPTTLGSYQTVRASTGSQAFVTEIQNLFFTGKIGRSTYLGGDGNTSGLAIANFDGAAVYVAGYTTSSRNFPGIFAGLSNTQEGFVSKLSHDLTQVEYTELRGGQLRGIALLKPTTPTGIAEIFVAGDTSTSDTNNALVERIDDETAQSQALWQNPTTGELFAGLLDAQGNVTSTQKLSVQCGPSNGCSQSWKVIGTLDVNRDGTGDILLYNATSGQLQAWLLNSSGAFIGMLSLSRLCGTSDGCSQNWKPVGLGDFNHDGIDDVLWHSDATGELQAWLLDGAGGVTSTLTLSKKCAVTDGCSTRYKLIAIGDFDRDGNDDLFWLDTTTGTVQISLLNGSGVVFDTRVLAKQCGPADGCSTTWKPFGMGDVNRDGIGDLLWENPATGELLAWLLNGTDRILGTQSLSLRCDATSGCPPNTLPVGILRNLQAAQ